MTKKIHSNIVNLTKRRGKHQKQFKDKNFSSIRDSFLSKLDKIKNNQESKNILDLNNQEIKDKEDNQNNVNSKNSTKKISNGYEDLNPLPETLCQYLKHSEINKNVEDLVNVEDEYNQNMDYKQVLTTCYIDLHFNDLDLIYLLAFYQKNNWNFKNNEGKFYNLLEELNLACLVIKSEYEESLKIAFSKLPKLTNYFNYFIEKYGNFNVTPKEINQSVIYLNNLQSFNSGLDYNLIAENIMTIGYTYNVKSKNMYEKKAKKSNIFKGPDQLLNGNLVHKNIRTIKKKENNENYENEPKLDYNSNNVLMKSNSSHIFKINLAK